MIRRLVPAALRRRYALKFGLVLLVIALSVGAIGLVETAMVADSVEERVLADQRQSAVEEAASLERWNDRNDQLLLSAAQAPVLGGEENESEIENYLADVYGELPDNARTNALYVDTETGEVLAGAGDDPDTLEGMAFPDGEKLDDDLSEYVVQRTDAYAMPDETSLAFDHRAVRSYYIGVDEDDRALVFTFDLAERSSEMPVATRSGTTVTILDEDGRLVADDAYLGYREDRETVVFEESYENDAVLAAVREGTPGAIRLEESPGDLLGGEPYEFAPEGYVVGYQTTNEGWIVLVHTAEEQAFGLVDSIAQVGALATLVGVVLVGVLGAAIGRTTAASIDRLTEKAARMEEGDLDVDLESSRIDNIGRLYDGFDAMRTELKATIAEAEDARAAAEAERDRLERLNRHLESKADEYSDAMEAAAEGDLTARMDPESENEAMAAIATDANEMLAEMEATVARLSAFATDVATAAEQVTASSEEVRAASEEVSGSIQEIADGADRQNDAVQSIETETNALSTTTEEIAASSNEVADVADRTARASREGNRAAQEAIDACDDLVAEHGTVVEEFEDLRTEVDRITSLTDTIAEIAEQTNMLALNANIEAARSSESSDTDGFATVAAEVKELSQEVKDAADRIDGRLESIEGQAERSARTVDRTGDEVERVTDLVSEAATALEGIADHAEATSAGIEDISAATEEQASSSEEVAAMVDEVATISEETTAEAESVAAAAEEQTSALTEVSGSADDLSQQANALSAALDRFETDATVDSKEESDDRSDSSDESDRGGISSDESNGGSEVPEDETPAAFEFDDAGVDDTDETEMDPASPDEERGG
ncbi:methyl-accepting chemotaxis protein [Natrialba sp. INN-245]|uniref:methyl-accepting chemotaxis protein n=1 Tax=Natrialba sp. INN-245 TaxID=2690967 RepID=UPI0013135C3F|nr:methyl-accepting chemotaxis protein [Natrialba sp. INN-245]MWV39416.1 HAMP domain-containing protein [Natrialba sp. INN-245]